MKHKFLSDSTESIPQDGEEMIRSEIICVSNLCRIRCLESQLKSRGKYGIVYLVILYALDKI